MKESFSEKKHGETPIEETMTLWTWRYTATQSWKKKSELKGWSPQLSIHLCFSIQRNYSPSNFKTLLKYHLEPAQVTLSYVNVSAAIYFSDEWFVIIDSVLLGTKL